MVVLAYLLGAIPFGYLIGKRKGIDIRQHGSGNIGTSNVKRILGKKAAAMTLLGDGLKGLIPVVMARALHLDGWWLVAVALAAIIGHNWPVYLKFKGGKGVTTTYGSFLGIALLPALLTILIWVIVSKTTKKASIAALSSSVCAPILAFTFGGSLPIVAFALITMALMYLRHIENIKRLLSGKELTLTETIKVEPLNNKDR